MTSQKGDTSNISIGLRFDITDYVEVSSTIITAFFTCLLRYIVLALPIKLCLLAQLGLRVRRVPFLCTTQEQFQAKCQKGEDPRKSIVTKGSHRGINEGAERIIGNEKVCAGKEWEGV